VTAAAFPGFLREWRWLRTASLSCCSRPLLRSRSTDAAVIVEDEIEMEFDGECAALVDRLWEG
jgi:Ni,Fe-hydrogenase I small subunit